MANNRSRRPRQPKATDLDESPDTVHRVALYVGAMVEYQKWVRRSLELRRQGKLKASEAATAKARKFMAFIFDIERGTDMRLINDAASKLARHTLSSRQATRRNGS